SNKDAATIVRSTIGLAHDLGLRVVAEGIESAESWKCLSELGCDVAQGYYIARPMPEHDLRKWMQEYCKTGVWTGYVKAA
ncbi:MAG: EAL domain-containing protein, partial [Acidiferrobacterales bacterium]